jgi:phosphatidate cytidylyltransferase
MIKHTESNMSNTKLRIISALVMMAMVIFAAFIGPKGIILLVFVAGVLLVDEILFNMLGINRNHLSYIASQVTFIFGYIFLNILDVNMNNFHVFIQAGVVINLFFSGYLFFEPMDRQITLSIFKKYTYLTGAIFLIPLMGLSYLVHQENWLNYVILLLVVTYSVDTGAWFFGKNFGTRKLWPKISPNKTLTGAISGAFTSVFLSSILIHFTFNKLSLPVIVCLFILAIVAQVGDLVESKMKRQLNVKDSSQLIPGHGGIYDRIDSLVFVAPFYAMMIKEYFI